MTKVIKYEKEYDMIQPIVDIAYSIAETPNVIAFLECVGSAGIADIVLVEFDKIAIEKREKNQLPPIINPVQIKVLFSLDESQPKDISSISSLTGYSPGYIKSSSIRPLINNGLIFKVKSGYIRTNLFCPVVKRIIAIEAKRENWTRGLYQARRYLRFANKVFLAIDKAYAKRIIPHKNTMKKQGIGLLLVDASSNKTFISSNPKWNTPISITDHALIGERLWYVLKNQNCDYQGLYFASLNSDIENLV